MPELDVIFGRRSIRKYTDRRVDHATVELLLKAAMAAPSAVAKDPWRFIVVREKATLENIARGLPNAKMLPSAAVGFVVCGDTAAAHGGEISYLLQDCSAAIENLLIAAHALGLGAVWLGVHPREERIAHVRKLFSLPPSIVPVSCVAAGYPAETREPRTRYSTGYVHNETW